MDRQTCLNMLNFLCRKAQMRLWRDPQCNQLLLSMGTSTIALVPALSGTISINSRIQIPDGFKFVTISYYSYLRVNIIVLPTLYLRFHRLNSNFIEYLQCTRYALESWQLGFDDKAHMVTRQSQLFRNDDPQSLKRSVSYSLFLVMCLLYMYYN